MSKRAVIVTNLDTGLEFLCDSLTQAAEMTDTSIDTVFSICASRFKRTHGYTYRYAEPRQQEMSPQQAVIVLELANHGLRVLPTAQKMFMTSRAVQYHIKKIRQITNKNPLDFWDMCDLVKIAERVLLGESDG